jgi:beta-1,4-glucuronyltransferase 1
VFHVAKRTGNFVHWEPVYVGTNAQPEYDERLSWEGRNDKMTQVREKLQIDCHPSLYVYLTTQGYAMCLLDYEFHILDNAFLVHRPGIKEYHKNKDTELLVNQTNVLVKGKYRYEIEKLYGTRKECGIAF